MSIFMTCSTQTRKFQNCVTQTCSLPFRIHTCDKAHTLLHASYTLVSRNHLTLECTTLLAFQRSHHMPLSIPTMYKIYKQPCTTLKQSFDNQVISNRLVSKNAPVHGSMKTDAKKQYSNDSKHTRSALIAMRRHRISCEVIGAEWYFTVADEEKILCILSVATRYPVQRHSDVEVCSPTLP